MTPERINSLLDKLLDRSLSEQERDAVLGYLRAIDDHELERLLAAAWERQRADKELPEAVSGKILAAIFSESSETVPRQSAFVPLRKYWLQVTAAAAIALLVITCSLFLLRQKQGPMLAGKRPLNKSIPVKTPGKNTAVLTLADGTRISLDDATKGVLAKDGNSTVTKLSDGRIAYQSAGGAAAATRFNTLKTPPGNLYELTLPDGSLVWLNAVSSIRFPTAFADSERRVEITGEVYFEIKKIYARDGKTRLPFIVDIHTAAGNSEVQVLGTHFNIKAYEDEAVIRTSLLEGSVKIWHEHSGSLLHPGQQAQATKGGALRIRRDIAMDEVMAWKNGYFQYDHVDLKTVLYDAARWYDLDVEFAGPVPADLFTGRIERSVSLARLIKWIQWSDVKVRLEGRRMIVE